MYSIDNRLEDWQKRQAYGKEKGFREWDEHSDLKIYEQKCSEFQAWKQEEFGNSVISSRAWIT